MKTLGLLLLLMLLGCERPLDCKWCTTVAKLPDCDLIVGQGYACGDDLDIIQERQFTWNDPETGEIYLVMTYCK